ncbi:Profilin/allergen [Penicillium italicum]|uniref:Profilin n=1 Tax=Penicillium italicum TaxID=40296 RepID=A0A0A2LE27_PENIT|nr:Profilin/allergen [Penicillium italicum]
MGSGQFDKAGILAADFSVVEAASPGFAVSSPVVFFLVRGGVTDFNTVANVSGFVGIQLSQEEINSLITAYTSSDQAFASGFSICGEKFVTIRADERSVYGKKGKEGVIIARASSCTIIAHHTEAVQTPNAATVVENLVDYLNNPQ